MESKKTGLIEFVKKIYKLLGTLLLLIIIVFLVTDLFDINPSIIEYRAPTFKSTEGIDNYELKNMLLDEIQNVFKQAKSLKGNETKFRKIINPFSIEFSGVKSNYDSFLQYMRKKMGVKSQDFTVSVTKIDNEYCYRIRLNGNLKNKNCILMDSLMGNVLLDTLLKKQARDIVGNFDPYILSMYYFKKNKFKKSLYFSQQALQIHPDSRKYALGTIANSFREIKEYDKAIEYYEKSKTEFPNFYPTKWQYSKLLLKISEFERAEKLALEVLTNDLSMKKLALTTLLKIYSAAKNESSFNRTKNQFVETYGKNEFEKLLNANTFNYTSPKKGL